MSSINRRNRRPIVKRNLKPLSAASHAFERKFVFGFGIFAVLFVAFLMAAFASPANPHDAKEPQQTAHAVSPESVDPLARLNRRIPGQGNTALALTGNMEGYSPESSKLMLAGFGGGGQAQQTTTVDYIYDGQQMIRTRKNGGPGATYFTGPRGPEYRRDDVTGAVSWYLYDGQKNVVGEVSPNGSVTSSRKFDVYGTVRGGNNPAGTSKHKFQGGLGHLSDDETGLVYMRARYFDPATGRFVSQDPVKHGLNWFSYCGNNPINFHDFTGKMEMGEEMEEMADGESLETELAADPAKLLEELRASSAPESLSGFTVHGASRFATRFEEIFGRPGTTQDGIDLLAKWNPGKAFIGSQGRWMNVVQMRGVLLYLVAEGDELHTFFEK